MPAWLFGALAVGALFLLARARSGPSLGPLKIAGPVALVGDSIAVGLAAPLGRLLRQRGLAFSSHGVVGSTARQWSSRIDQVLAARPKTVIVNLGGNDAASAVLTQEFSQNIRRIIGKIRAAGAEPILLEPPSRPSPSFVTIQQALRSAGVVLFIPSPELPRAADGIHFTANGYRMWAEDIADASLPG